MFNYPDYWKMPREISYKLSPDAVDVIQYMIHTALPQAFPAKKFKI